jgi:hypothetical protein
MAKVLASGLDRHVLPINEIRSTVLNQPSKEQLALPFYNDLPKDPIELLKWKIYVRERCLTDLEFRADIEEMCRLDVGFFAATFGHVFEPRPPRNIPLTPWTDQMDVIIWLVECYEQHRDAGCEKTRGIGVSWVIALIAYWIWKYVPDAKIALTTKDETTLDGPDANSLLGKIVYLHDHMPAWARIGKNGKNIMRRTSDQHILQNLLTGAVAQGFAPTDDKLRSLRFTICFYDEFAFFPRKTQETLNASIHTAPCRIFISTWHGAGNAFHSMMRVEKSTMLRIQAYWWNNPERWMGAYTTEAGRLKIIETSYPFPPDYPFVLDGLLRSPWVDFELRRPGQDMQTNLEELYGLQAESGRKLIRPATLDVVYATLEKPVFVGEIDVTGKKAILYPKADGRLKLYANLGDGRGGPFSAASDLGFGHGASNSTLEVIDLATAKQVLDFADNTIDPVSFAQFVVGVLRWLCGHKGDGYCFLDFENNGDQGTSFGNELLRLMYGNIRERRYNRKVPNMDRTTYLGTRNKDGGLANILEMERAILNGELIVTSAEVWEELGHFDKDADGKPVYNIVAGRGHGDRVQGLGIAWMQARDKLLDSPAADSRETAQDEIRNIRPDDDDDWSAGWSYRRSA